MVDQIIELPLPGRTFVAQPRGEATSETAVTVPAFVAGPENQLVAATIRRLVESVDATAANDEKAGRCPFPPSVLALFGPTGSGKTHLIRGLVAHWQRHRGASTAVYTTAADFQRQLQAAISAEKVADFRNDCRTRELLAIDDLHQLADKDYLQQELRHTLDAIYDAGGIAVVASGQPVTALPNLPPDLRSRLAAGLMLQLALPGSDARVRIVRHVSAALGRPLMRETLACLVAGVRGSTRELIGAMFQLCATLPANQAISPAQVECLLDERRTPPPTLREIIAVVARYFRLPQNRLKSSGRQQSLVLARATVAYLARRLTTASFDEIGQSLGGRDHSTIMHSLRKLERELQHDAATQAAIDDLGRLLNHG